MASNNHFQNTDGTYSMKSKVTALLAVLLSSSAAFAADLPYKGAAPVAAQQAVNPFQGFYVGASAGYASGDATVFGVDLNPTGFTGGAQAGYNVTFGNFLIGLEGDAAYANLSNTSQNITLGSGFLADVTARAGVTFGNALVYGKGGWAYFNANALTSGINGFVFGGGAEYLFTQHVSVKAEYLHYDFGSETITGLPVLSKVTADSFKAGVNYHF